MSITQKALQFAIRPLLNERHRTGYAEGHAEGRAEMNQEWEARLRQWRETGATTWPDDPSPPVKPSE